MIAAIVAVALGTSPGLTRAESAMVNALRDLNIPAIKKLVDKQAVFVSIFPHLRGNPSPYDLPESYYAGWTLMKPGEKEESVNVYLDRLSRVMKKSRAPREVVSKHNDLTKHTVRGYASPEDYWEAHFDVRKDGSIRLQRVCEFYHASNFVWIIQPERTSILHGSKKSRPNQQDFALLRALKSKDIRKIRPYLPHPIRLHTSGVVPQAILPNNIMDKFAVGPADLLRWAIVDSGTLSAKTSPRKARAMLETFAPAITLYKAKNAVKDGGVDYSTNTHPRRSEMLSIFETLYTMLYIEIETRHKAPPALTQVYFDWRTLCFGADWNNQHD
ncbi:MAG: hypothetical protein WCG75_08330 [Armatimonadota bacterium]